jgi:hypothetical protein
MFFEDESMTPDQWVAFAESGNQQRLNAHHGATLQGWIMEITDDALLISSGDGERGVEQWLNLADIEVASLAYFDTRSRQWTAFVPTPTPAAP